MSFSILNKLRQPYVFHTSIKRRWIFCFLFGSFVFLFLYFFRPFDIVHSPAGIFNACLGYGLTTFVIMALLNIALLPLFPKFLSEDSWTVGKEIGWSLLNIFLIGLGNVLFAAFVGNVRVSLFSIVMIEMYTLAIGIFPVTVSVLLKEARLKKRYEKESEQINVELKEHFDAVQELYDGRINTEETTEAREQEMIIRISSENAAEDLELPLDALLYIQSSDNYIEVHFRQQSSTARRLLRNSLKSVAESLSRHPQLFRCHKSYLVNLDKVTHVSGNAQGYKLHILDSEIVIPVSRQHNETIKARITGNT